METLKRLLCCVWYDPKRVCEWFRGVPRRFACWRSSETYRKVHREVMASYLFGPKKLIWSLLRSNLALLGFVLMLWNLPGLVFHDHFLRKYGWIGGLFWLLIVLALWSITHMGLQDLETPIATAHRRAYRAVLDERARCASSQNPPQHQPQNPSQAAQYQPQNHSQTPSHSARRVRRQS